MEPQKQKMSKETKQVLWVHVVLLLFVVLNLIWQPLMLRNNKKTCAYAYGKHKTNGTSYIKYSFQNQDNNWVTATEGAGDYKVKDLKTLQKMGCIKIIYSTSQNGTIEVVDERMVIKE
jgi:hypothetical protein